MQKEYDRVKVYRQTQAYYRDFPEQESTIYTELPSLPNIYGQGQGQRQTKVVFVKSDCIDTTRDYLKAGYRVILHNMSDWKVPGGRVDEGSGAQEEELFRRSNYFKHLHHKYYPFSGLQTVVSKGVEYFRDGSSNGYLETDKMRIDTIASPALRFPQLSPDGHRFAISADATLMKDKIRMLFLVAANEGADCLILSAWGCGAYGCPAKHVAQLFKEVLQEYDGLLKTVVFAILGINYELFKGAW